MEKWPTEPPAPIAYDVSLHANPGEVDALAAEGWVVDDDPQHVVSAVVVVCKRDRMLLLKRGPPDPWMPGRWCFRAAGTP